jgi:hypothetical protein
MTVLEFPQPERPSNEWQSPELAAILEAYEPQEAFGDRGGWAVGKTELGDPQLYLLGPAPDHECLLCVSRLGRLYVLDDGDGRLLFEHGSLVLLAEQIRLALRAPTAGVVARVTAAWFAVRKAFEEKVEPLLGEEAEFLSHVAPQLVAVV